VFIVFLNGSELSWWMGGCLMLIYVIYAAVLVQGVGAADEEGELTTTLNAFSNPMLEEGKGSEDLELADRTKGGEDTDDTADADEPESETDAKSEVGQPEEPDSADADDEELPSCGLALVTFDFNPLIYSSSAEDFSSASQAWVVLLCSTLVIAFACYVLAEAVMLSAKALGIAPYFTAVILGAAASSVPDTYISYKDALKGDYDDAVRLHGHRPDRAARTYLTGVGAACQVANAIGSNIFDICFALGLPLFLYGLIHGSVAMNEVRANRTLVRYPA
jgi:Ca2+/Na+ antiporter